jgi:NDP-sugar pyrophosphorylase family protein
VTGWATALVLTAGLGTRLFPLTLARSKCAAPVAGVPLVVRILRWLSSQGIRDAVLNLHHRPESVAAVVGDGTGTGCAVRYSWEGQEVLGSAGGPRHALPLLARERFFVVNGDTLTDLRLTDLAAAHEASGAEVTLAVVPNREPARYGGVLVEPGGEVTGFTRRGDPRPSWHFVGVQMADARAFESLPDNVRAESVGGLYTTRIASTPGAIRAWCTDGAFLDIGTPADYFRANVLVAEQEHVAWPLLGSDCAIAPSAEVATSILWNGVTVGPHARLDRCVVADRACVPASASYSECAVTPAPAQAIPPRGARIEAGLMVVPLRGQP